MWFKRAIPAREQYEHWAPLWMRELVGGKSSAEAVNDRFFLRCDIAHEYSHDHSGMLAREVDLCDVSEVGLEFGEVGDRGLYLDKTDAGCWVYHGEAALFEREPTAPWVMDCSVDEKRGGRRARCPRHSENAGQQAFWGEPCFNQAAHLGFKKAVRQIRMRAGWHEPMELSQATRDVASKLCGSLFYVDLGWHGRIETRHCVLASFIVLRVKAPRDSRSIYDYALRRHPVKPLETAPCLRGGKPRLPDDEVVVVLSEAPDKVMERGLGPNTKQFRF